MFNKTRSFSAAAAVGLVGAASLLSFARSAHAVDANTSTRASRERGLLSEPGAAMKCAICANEESTN